MSSTEREVDLRTLIRSELLNIPLAQWGFFFPVHVAVWRFIHGMRPSILGELDAGYDDEPYFRGHGAKWFIDLTNNDRYTDLVEEIMRSASSELPSAAFDRGFVIEDELPPIDAPTVDKLRSVIIEEVQRAT